MLTALKDATGRTAPDLVTFYLDDKIIAGKTGAVAGALAQLRAECARRGLRLNLDKSELILPAHSGVARATLEDAFPPELLRDPETGADRVIVEDFELLGCPIGSPSHCAAFTKDKVEAAKVLLAEVAEFDDPQCALRLMSRAAGYAKLVHISRSTPFESHLAELAAFDAAVRATFCNQFGFCPSDLAWEQARLGAREAGLGLRSAAGHAAAAYCSSAHACRALCAEIDPAYDPGLGGDAAYHARALAAVNSYLPLPKRFAAPASQRAMSSALGSASFERLRQAAPPPVQASLLSEREHGARAFLQAVPSEALGLTFSPALFVATVRSRLCTEFLSEDVWCPLCDPVLDARGFHARVCAAGGDRKTCHHAVRNCISGARKRPCSAPSSSGPGSFYLCPHRTCTPAGAVRPTCTSLRGSQGPPLHSMSP